MNLKELIGNGDRIGLFTAPFVILGVTLNIMFPSFFEVGGPSGILRAISVVVLLPGVVIWIWSVILIVTRVPRKELMSTGPYSLVKHPLYTSVSFLVLPWIGILCDTWLGVALGIILYVASRFFSREEEKVLSTTFGVAWDEYRRNVKVPWL